MTRHHRTDELVRALSGVNSFPVTPFDARGGLDLDRLAEHVDHQVRHGATSVFPACGTGEFAALSPGECRDVVEQTVRTVAGRLPVIAGVGINLSVAREQLASFEQAGVDGVLLLPPYLAPGDPEALADYYRGVITATDLPVLLYVRPEAPLDADALLRLCEHANVLGVKDGSGDAERLSRLAGALGEERVVVNGMPTAELSAAAFRGLGVGGYSSAVYNFVPDIAMAFRQAATDLDGARQEQILEAFYRPFGALRDRRRGYAVSLVKAGVSALLGSVGAPRAPLPAADDRTTRALIDLVEKARAEIGSDSER
ncbi:5-dehydro-4-deoxyglucarate dehydratase [Jiangella sp. DSM 45060]|uniref:5-dehydro-4-deoxyglucarate dehydratase n=1 Tax=Jiangella sp. DSM 45060 TaxID=1798224 RepID=UPI00087B11C0|nr:5-dehydro-4-deoxyglucarate dehydratase [Jiangella sp. DSM 45060]SDS45722.1 5-dehydro-4-deoxyglucarate dehydratase [Jiangella sp. DSM 45060]